MSDTFEERGNGSEDTDFRRDDSPLAVIGSVLSRGVAHDFNCGLEDGQCDCGAERTSDSLESLFEKIESGQPIPLGEERTSECPRCRAEGVIPVRMKDPNGTVAFDEEECPDCQGRCIVTPTREKEIEKVQAAERIAGAIEFFKNEEGVFSGSTGLGGPQAEKLLSALDDFKAANESERELSSAC